jgi:hypothetical protein
LTGLIHELAVLTLFAVSGTIASHLIGIRSIWLAVGFGTLIGSALRTITFSVSNLFDLLYLSGWLFIALALAITIFGFWFAKEKPQLGKSLALAGSVSVLAVISTRVIGLSPIGHGDSRWILTIAEHMQNAGDMGVLNGRTSIKRGFAYPQLLALGPEGEYLSGITPFIFGSLALVAIWAVLELTKSIPTRAVLIAGIPVILAIITATVPLRAIFYINGHTLTALGMLVSAIAIVIALRDSKLSNQGLWLISIGFFVASTSRPEGIAMVALIALPFLAQKWISRTHQRIIISSATVGLSIWLSVYNSYIINETTLPWFVFSAIFIGLGILPTLSVFDFIRHRLVPLAFAAMVLVITASQILFADALAKGNASQFENLILGAGLWGYLAIGLVIATLVIGIKGTSDNYKRLLTISLLLVLGTFIAKMIDGGQFGNPTLGRIGWSDSLNRMWIHSFAILVITLWVGLSERLGKKQ